MDRPDPEWAFLVAVEELGWCDIFDDSTKRWDFQMGLVWFSLPYPTLDSVVELVKFAFSYGLHLDLLRQLAYVDDLRLCDKVPWYSPEKRKPGMITLRKWLEEQDVDIDVVLAAIVREAPSI